MPRRRDALKLLAAAAATPVGVLHAATESTSDDPPVNDDGLYTQPWFLQTFLEMGDDLDVRLQRGELRCRVAGVDDGGWSGVEG